MRRVLASVLLVLFSFALIAPALASEPESNLPACCRRGGKHECQMHGSAGQSGPALLAASCPYYAGVRGISAQPVSIALASALNALTTLLLSNAALYVQAISFLLISFSRFAQKRGPPALLS